MPQQQGDDWSKWATDKGKEIASKENRPIDRVSFNPISGRDAIELVIESGDQKITETIEASLFGENANMRGELAKIVRMAVREIKLKR